MVQVLACEVSAEKGREATVGRNFVFLTLTVCTSLINSTTPAVSLSLRYRKFSCLSLLVFCTLQKKNC